MLVHDHVPTIPIWINGHSFLRVATSYQDIRNANSGEVVRRTPICGTEEAEIAVSSARASVDSWAKLPEGDRWAVLSSMGGALGQYCDHFANLIAEESGKGHSDCVEEINEAIALLTTVSRSEMKGVVAIVGNRAAPLLGVLRLAVPALAAGAAVIIRPCVEAPGALFAMAELSARCGLPDGVVSIIYGADPLVHRLRQYQDISLHFA